MLVIHLNVFFFICSLVPKQKYCESIHQTRRRKHRTMMVNNVPMGSNHLIRIQTMTTSDTKDVAKTEEEVCAPYLRCMGLFSVLSVVLFCLLCLNLI
jgi:hypothetical protein